MRLGRGSAGRREQAGARPEETALSAHGEGFGRSPRSLYRPLLEALQAQLREKRLLLVLDNFEHLLEAAPEVASLVTSPTARFMSEPQQLCVPGWARRTSRWRGASDDLRARGGVCPRRRRSLTRMSSEQNARSVGVRQEKARIYEASRGVDTPLTVAQ